MPWRENFTASILKCWNIRLKVKPANLYIPTSSEEPKPFIFNFMKMFNSHIILNLIPIIWKICTVKKYLFIHIQRRVFPSNLIQSEPILAWIMTQSAVRRIICMRKIPLSVLIRSNSSFLILVRRHPKKRQLFREVFVVTKFWMLKVNINCP